MSLNSNIKLFLVEDDPVQAQVLSDKMLEYNSKFSITWFKSGEDLLETLEQTYNRIKHHYVILDYFLQTTENSDALNGLQIIRLLAEKYHKVYVILFSSYDSDENLDFVKIKEEPNVLDFIKKSEYAYSSLQNTIRFHYSKILLDAKKRRFHWALVVFIGLLLISSLHFIFSFLSV